jgi:hypothetical protein
MLFQWTILRNGEFRLLRPRQLLSDGQLSYELRTVTTQTTPVYVMVRYARTTEDKDQAVLLNGRTRMVTKTAAQALHDVAKNQAYDYLWIDCLCINEGDAEELARQQMLLNGIEASAALVHVYRDPHGQSAVL